MTRCLRHPSALSQRKLGWDPGLIVFIPRLDRGTLADFKYLAKRELIPYMSNNAKMARPYARAVFEYAQEHKSTQQWAQMFALLAKAFTDPNLLRVVKNPNVEPQVLTDICIALGKDQLDSEQRNFIKILAHEDRLFLTPEIARQFAALKAEAEKVINAEVTCAQDLSAEDQKKLIAALSKRFNREVTLTIKVNPELISGCEIRIGDEVIENTVRAQIKRLRESLIQY